MKKIIYVDMDDVLADFTSAHRSMRRRTPEITYPQSVVGFFEHLTPIANAVESVNILRNESKFDLYVLTAPSCRNVHSYAEKRIWIEKYFDYEFTKKLIICANKSLLKGDVLIDDHLQGKGQEGFGGELIHYGSEKCPNWASVMAYLSSNVL